MVKNMPEAIINLPKGMEFSNQKPEIEVIVKKNGKTIYHNKTYAIVMNMVQSITTMTEEKGDVTLEGDSQVFGCGNAIIQMFAIHELNRKMKDVITRAMLELQQLIKEPELFKRNSETLKS